MSEDTRYVPVPFIYKSRGLIARDITDQAPEYTYLSNMNTQEREENSLSSRYGTEIINRDPVGTGTTNYPLPSNVINLTRLVYQGSSYRYASTVAGLLYRRTGDTQGAYTQLTLPDSITGSPVTLAGTKFSSIVQSCFETSQPYLFLYDAGASIKDMGTGEPQLTGIDPPQYTANTNPYAPLLLMVDNFASGNSYTTSGISPWGWGNIETLDATSGQLITDFSQFYGVGPSGGGGGTRYPSSGSVGSTSATATRIPVGSTTNTSTAVSGFASVVPAAGEQVTIYLAVHGTITVTVEAGYGTAYYQFSPDGGSTWVYIQQFGYISTTSFNQTISTTLLTANLSLVQVRVQCTSNVGATDGGAVATTAYIDSLYAVVSSPGAFGPISNGMLALLNTNTLVSVPISSVVSTNLVDGIYEGLLVTTTVVHGVVSGDLIAIYASSNDLVDGFYEVFATPSTTQFVVDFLSATLIGATGGYITYTTAGSGDADVPSACVLTNQYSTPYPTQMSAWGFYQWVPPTTTSFPIGAYSGTIASASSTGTVSKTVTLDLNQNNQVTDGDLIVMTLLTSNPENIAQIQLQFFVGAGTNNYYSAFISPAYYQGAVAGGVLAYQATENQILADTLGLITGQPPGTTSAQLQPTNISTGSGSWQACYIPRGNFLPVGQAGQAGLDWSNVTSWQLSVTTNANGGASFSVNGLYLQWGYGPSSFAGIGYDWRYTYYNANTGTESSPCPEQEFNEDFGYLASTSAPIFLRQAAQVVGQYSNDPQVTHVRLYRRGGTLSDNWIQTVQAVNVTGGGQFVLKDVIADSYIEQSPLLVLDNDPPVTSSLVTPIQTTLSASTTQTGLSSIYSTFSPQTVTVVESGAVFVPNQLVIVGNANNEEEVAVVTGGTGTFTAILRLEHNQGEPVTVEAIPRQPCDLCALAYDRVWLAGDPNNPGYLYYSKVGQPENFGPENYLVVTSPSDPINAVINWRGTLYVATQNTWFIIQGGAQPIAQPTGSQHGVIAKAGWVQTESAIWYRAADGLREFRGSDGIYTSLPVEWIYRDNPLTPLPLADPTQASQDVMCYYNNDVYVSYISTSATSGRRFRLIWSTLYKRFRIDSLPMTAMLWETDTNTFLGAYDLIFNQNYIVKDQVYSMDYDDIGWTGGSLNQAPIQMTIQTPYTDLGKPHFPKQWNVIETDVNTQGLDQVMGTTLVFDDGSVSVGLATAATTQRQKVELQVNGGAGQQGYRMSIIHSITSYVAPIFYQENVYAAELAAFRYTFDTYWILGGTDEFKVLKEAYFDFTSALATTFNLYADNSTTPYYTFTLAAQPNRATVRVRFPALKMRDFRMIGNIASGDTGLQMWKAPQLRWKPCREGAGYSMMDLVT